ncbi:MAG: hypothetical protein L3J39_14765 [Verrucomicrobiales bacterium]|nr:hypothetical protein [Verrucomicrobiales bacterium]
MSNLLNKKIVIFLFLVFTFGEFTFSEDAATIWNHKYDYTVTFVDTKYPNNKKTLSISLVFVKYSEKSDQKILYSLRENLRKIAILQCSSKKQYKELDLKSNVDISSERKGAG